MSLQSSMAVMKAKLAGNISALQALAMQGDFEAVAALKEMADKRAYAQSAANETAMSQEDTLPVMQQMVGQLQTPQSGLAAYAQGGRAFASGDIVDPEGLDWREGEGILGRARRRFAEMVRGLQFPEQSYAASRPGGLREGIAAAAPVAAPGAASVATPNAGKRLQRQQGVGETATRPAYSGIAAAAAPAETSPPSNGAFDPVKRMQRQAGAGAPMPDLPSADTQTDDQLRAHLEAMEPLQKKRDELREMSRKQLEAAYNAKVKLLTPSKYDQVMSFLAGVQERGGRSAAQALGAGAQSMHRLNKTSQEKLAATKELYDKADLLEQEALLKDKMDDAEGAYKLRQQAAALQKQIAAQKSTENLQGAQADYYRGARADQARAAAEASRARANRPTGIAGGVKPIDPVKRANLIKQEADALAKAEGLDLEIMTRTQREALDARATAIVDKRLGKPVAASPAAPSGGVKFLGFE